MDLAPVALRVGPVLLPDRRNGQHAAVLVGAGIGLVDRRQMMDLLTRIEASLEFMHDGGPIRVDFVNLREVLEGSREALLKLDEYERREKLHMERIVALEQQNEALASRLDSAENAMREVVSHLQRSERGSTHW